MNTVKPERIPNYEISYEPMSRMPGSKLSEQASENINRFYGLLKSGEESTDLEKELRIAMERNPEIPTFRNYLASCLARQGRYREAGRIHRETHRLFPDYVFGLISLAAFLLKNGNPDSARGYLGRDMEISSVFPGKKIFHITEILAFEKTVAVYWLIKDRFDLAYPRYERMKNLIPEHPEILALEHLLLVHGDKHAFPSFKNRELIGLTRRGADINPNLLRDIKLLPRRGLVRDLIRLLETAIRFEGYFRLASEKGELEDPETWFPAHAIRLLMDLNAEEAWDAMFRLFKLGTETLEFWFGDFTSEIIVAGLAALGRKRIGRVRSYAMDNPCVFDSCDYTISIPTQIALKYPEKTVKAAVFLGDIGHKILEEYRRNPEAADRKKFVDFFSSWTHEVLDLNLKEYAPLVEALHELGLMDEQNCGTMEEIRAELDGPPDPYWRPNYSEIVSFYGWMTDRTGEEEPENADPTPAVKPVKPGRNDPCPCGSGKKYKKCCGA